MGMQGTGTPQFEESDASLLTYWVPTFQTLPMEEAKKEAIVENATKKAVICSCTGAKQNAHAFLPVVWEIRCRSCRNVSSNPPCFFFVSHQKTLYHNPPQTFQRSNTLASQKAATTTTTTTRRTRILTFPRPCPLPRHFFSRS